MISAVTAGVTVTHAILQPCSVTDAIKALKAFVITSGPVGQGLKQGCMVQETPNAILASTTTCKSQCSEDSQVLGIFKRRFHPP